MKILLLFLTVFLFIETGYSQNLAATADIYASSTNGSNTKDKTVDNNTVTFWQSSTTGNQYIQYHLTKNVKFAKIELTNVATYTGSIQVSSDGTNWTMANGSAGNFFSCSYACFNHIYIINGGQFIGYSYIKINLSPYGSDKVSIAEVAITEETSLISSFSGSGYTTGNPPINAIDFNTSTYFENYGSDLNLTIQLSKSVGAINASITASVSNIKVGISGTGGNYDSYYYTLNPTEQFLIASPGGIQTVTLSISAAKIYDFTMVEVPLSNIPPMTYSYDAAGNMTTRTILLSMSKSAFDETRDTIIPENPEMKKEKPYTDDFAGKKIFVYPVPTKGLLTIDFKNLDEKDKVSVQIFSETGQKLLEKYVTGSSTVLDLNNKANGIYYLNIRINSETHKWTIIKE